MELSDSERSINFPPKIRRDFEEEEDIECDNPEFQLHSSSSAAAETTFQDVSSNLLNQMSTVWASSFPRSRHWPFLEWPQHLFKKSGPFPASFSLPIFVFSIQLIVNNVHINFADDWIQTVDLWYRKRPLYQWDKTTPHGHGILIDKFCMIQVLLKFLLTK